MAELAVIIPHYNDVSRLSRCLEALMVQDLGAVEVAVVDNDSPTDMSAIKTRFSGVNWITEATRGAAAARNRGVAETSAPWIAFLDSDCVPASNWLERAREIAQGPMHITGGAVSVFDETRPPRSGAEAFETVFAFDQADYIRNKGFSVTANLIVPRVIFEAVGPLIVGRSEDLDWCRRATAAGYNLTYDALLSVAHPTRSDWEELRRKWRRLTAEGFETHRANENRTLAWALRGMAMPLSAVLHLSRILRSPDLSGLEKSRGAATLFRLRFLRMIWMLRQTITGRANL